jgi:hypothetical protein
MAAARVLWLKTHPLLGISDKDVEDPTIVVNNRNPDTPVRKRNLNYETWR